MTTCMGQVFDGEPFAAGCVWHGVLFSRGACETTSHVADAVHHSGASVRGLQGSGAAGVAFRGGACVSAMGNAFRIRIGCARGREEGV